MSSSLQLISELGILPVVCPPTVESSEPLADALCQGGLPAIEITLRAAWAIESIRRIRAAFPKMLIGAGTVYTTEQVDSAVQAGASFIVSPGLDPAVVTYCQQREIPIVPGCATPSDMTQALRLGLKTLKFFPAELSGGVAALKLYHGPFADCTFVPTGGLNLTNIAGYLELPYVAACGGSFIAPKDAVQSGNFAKITALCQDCCKVALGLAFSQVVLGTASADASLPKFGQLPGLSAQLPIRWDDHKLQSEAPQDEAESCGKLVFTTISLPRVLAWYKRQGLVIEDTAIKRDQNGKANSVILPERLGGMLVEIQKR